MPKNVLVLNDSQGSLTPLIESLAQSGYTPYSTHHSEQCLDLFGEVNAKTLLLSLQAKQALEPLPLIRQDPDGATIPILFFGTGAEEVTGNTDAHRQGGDCYFEHPINIGEVVKKIRSFVGTGEERPVAIPGAPNAFPPRLPTPLQLDSLPLPSPDTLIPGNEGLTTAAGALLDRIYHKEAIDGEAKTAAECQRSTLETQLLQRKEATETRLAQLRARITEEAAAAAAVKSTKASLSKAEKDLRTRLEQLQHENFETTTLRQLEQERRQSLENQLQHAEQSQQHLTSQVSELSSALNLSKVEKEKTEETLQATEQRLSSQLLDQSRELEEVREQTHLRQQENRELQLALTQTQQEQRRPPAPPIEIPTADVAPPASPAPRVSPVAGPPAPTPNSPSPHRQRSYPKLQDAAVTPGNTLPELLLNAFATHYTGAVEFTQNQDHKTLYFEAGKPVDAYSNRPEDQLEAQLYRAGKLDHAPSQPLRAPENKSARMLSSELVTSGQLKPEELFTTAHDHLTELLYSLFEWESGHYNLSETAADPENHIPLSLPPPALLMEGIRRKYLLPRMISMVGSPSTVPGARPSFEERGESLLLTPTEKRLLPLIDGVRPIEELVFTTGLPSLNVYQVLTGLLTASALTILVPGTEPCNAEGDPTSEAIDKKRIQKKFKQIHSGDYFEIFGLSRSATPHEIERAFERLINDFSDQELAPGVSSQFTRELDEIRQVLDDARFVLLNPQTRQSYSRNL